MNTPATRGAFGQLDIGQVAAAPVLVARARNARRHAGNRRHGGKGQGERGAFKVHDRWGLSNCGMRGNCPWIGIAQVAAATFLAAGLERCGRSNSAARPQAIVIDPSKAIGNENCDGPSNTTSADTGT